MEQVADFTESCHEVEAFIFAVFSMICTFLCSKMKSKEWQA